jgi:hypothetical protein
MWFPVDKNYNIYNLNFIEIIQKYINYIDNLTVKTGKKTILNCIKILFNSRFFNHDFYNLYIQIIKIKKCYYIKIH